MLATYTAIDGYDIVSTVTVAYLMDDTTGAHTGTVSDVSGNSPVHNASITGSLTRAVVASNSTTVAWSGFDVSNYITEAYSSVFDPSTNDFSGGVWIKRNTISSSEQIFKRDSVSTGNYYQLWMTSTGAISFAVYDGTTTRTVTSTITIDDNLWHKINYVYDASTGTLYLYLDGSLDNSATGSVLNTLSNATAIFRIGISTSTTSPFGGSITGFQLDIGNAWTAQRILTQYNNESLLFEQYALFSIIGNSYNYSEGLANSNIGQTVRKSYKETLSGKIKTVIHNNKRVYSYNTIPFINTSLASAYHFLRSTESGTFTFDERGSAGSPDNPITVYKVSSSEKIARIQNSKYGSDRYQYSFSVRQS